MGDKYPEYIYQAIRQNWGYDEDDSSHDDEIDALSREDVLDAVASWNGLIGYGSTIREWVEDIYGVELL